MGKVVLITGGARSGKSRHAEEYIKAYPSPWAYLATAEARDEEMAARIGFHRARRAEAWRTVETPLYLVDALVESEDWSSAQLVDCLTLWLSNLLEKNADIGSEVERLCAKLGSGDGLVVLVTNEVGQGIVPDNALARHFRDEAGRMNQAVAEIADEVIFMVSGIPMQIKPT